MNRRFWGRSEANASGPRPSPIAGQWYPGAPDRLREQVQGYLNAAQVEPLPGRVVGLVAPHAGYAYSGGVAAHAYRLVEGKRFEVVAIIAPNHRIPNRAAYLTTSHGAYATPLGEVPVAKDLIGTLGDRIGLDFVRMDEEHSLEIQLPFLQVALADGFDLLPVMLNDQSRNACYSLGNALAELLRDRDALLIASTDLSHFYDVQTAARLDQAITDRIAGFDPEGLLDVLDCGEGQACGGGPTAAVMLAARALGADGAKTLKYGTSGDRTGDFQRVVGYAAAVLYQEVEPRR